MYLSIKFVAMSGTKKQENQNETPPNLRFHFDRVPMDPAPLDQNDRQDERAVEPADDQSVDWQKKFEDSERVNKQLRDKMRTMAIRINKKMKNSKMEKNKMKEKFVDLLGENSPF